MVGNGSLILLVLGLAGCGEIFDLTPVEEIPYYGQVRAFGTGDLDDDGLGDDEDPCVAIPQDVLLGRLDTDGDGVGDLCDPEPMTPGNCLVLFDSFDGATLSPHWQVDGQDAVLDGDNLQIPYAEEAHVYLDTPLTMQSIYAEIYVQNGANSGGPYHAVQLFFDLQRSPLATGKACSVEGDNAASQLAGLDVVRGVPSTATSSPIGNIPFGAGSTISSLAWSTDGCSAEMDGGGDNGSATLSVAPPPSGVFGVRIVEAGVYLKVIAAYGRGCTE